MTFEISPAQVLAVRRGMIHQSICCVILFVVLASAVVFTAKELTATIGFGLVFFGAVLGAGPWYLLRHTMGGLKDLVGLTFNVSDEEIIEIGPMNRKATRLSTVTGIKAIRGSRTRNIQFIEITTTEKPIRLGCIERGEEFLSQLRVRCPDALYDERLQWFI